jgi:hypothetical protein
LDVTVCEHLFVTSQGSPDGRFRRALERGNLTEALSAASELRYVGLLEALRALPAAPRQGSREIQPRGRPMA